MFPGEDDPLERVALKHLVLCFFLAISDLLKYSCGIWGTVGGTGAVIAC